MDEIKKAIRTIPDFPKKGIMFRDITTLLQDKKAFALACDALFAHYKGRKIDAIVGIESRGFVFGAVLAKQLGCGLVLARKKGKLPNDVIEETYNLEYGTATLEMHKGAIKKGQSIVIVDDLLATGGTSNAAAKLVEKLGGRVEEFCFVVELPALGGREKLGKYKIFNLVDFEGD